MTNKELLVNGKSSETIRRGPSKPKSYTMISVAMLHDKEISPECKAVLAYILSFKEDEKFNIAALSENMCFTEKKTLSIIKKLVKAGYASQSEIESGEGSGKETCYKFIVQQVVAQTQEEAYQSESHAYKMDLYSGKIPLYDQKLSPSELKNKQEGGTGE